MTLVVLVVVLIEWGVFVYVKEGWEALDRVGSACCLGHIELVALDGVIGWVIRVGLDYIRIG